jgi:hypothetical protein
MAYIETNPPRFFVLEAAKDWTRSEDLSNPAYAAAIW